jgi:hypothetical protein
LSITVILLLIAVADKRLMKKAGFYGAVQVSSPEFG